MRTTLSRLSKWRNSWKDSISYPRSRWTNPFTGQLPPGIFSTKATMWDGGDAKPSSAAPGHLGLASVPSQSSSLRAKARSRSSQRDRRTVPRAWLVCSFLHPFIHSSQIVESQPWARPCAGCKYAAVRSWNTAPPSTGRPAAQNLPAMWSWTSSFPSLG